MKEEIVEGQLGRFSRDEKRAITKDMYVPRKRSLNLKFVIGHDKREE